MLPHIPGTEGFSTTWEMWQIWGMCKLMYIIFPIVINPSESDTTV